MTDPRRIGEAELHAFVDGELDEAERAEMDALLDASPADFALARELRELNEAMAARYAYRFSAPVPRAMLQQLARVSRWPSDLAGRQAALAAGLLIALTAGIAGYVARGYIAGPAPLAQAPAFVANAIGAHTVYLPEVRHPVEVGAAEEAHLVQWLTKRLGAPVRAPVLGGLGWRLVGGRLLPDQGLPAAQFMYEDAGGRRLTLYVRKETGLTNTSFRFAETGGFGAFYWIDRPLAYAIAGRLEREELMAVANAVYAQLEALTPKAPDEPRKQP